MDEKIKYWIELAEYDLETADVMLKSKRYLYVGFMCHQAIEKAFKALYVSVKNDMPPYTHNLDYLAEKTETYDNLSEDYKDIIDLLTPLNIEARYPSHKEKLMKDLNHTKCLRIISSTKELFEWIKTQLQNV